MNCSQCIREQELTFEDGVGGVEVADHSSLFCEEKKQTGLFLGRSVAIIGKLVTYLLKRKNVNNFLKYNGIILATSLTRQLVHVRYDLCF